MKITLSTEQAIQELLKDKDAGWTHEQAEAIVKDIEDFEDISGEEVEMDPIAIRCKYSVFSQDEILDTYWHLLNIDEKELATLEKEDVHIIVMDGLCGDFNVIALSGYNYIIEE